MITYEKYVSILRESQNTWVRSMTQAKDKKAMCVTGCCPECHDDLVASGEKLYERKRQRLYGRDSSVSGYRPRG